MYEIFVQLCQEKGVTSYRVSMATGVSQGSLSDWKHGKSTPKIDKLEKIADYFGVSVAYLRGETEIRNAPAVEDEGDPELIELLETLKERSDMRMLFRLSKNATPEDVLTAVKIIEALRSE